MRIFSKCKFAKKCKLYDKTGVVCNKYAGEYGQGKMATCYYDNVETGEHLK
jgi:hypothetical protein